MKLKLYIFRNGQFEVFLPRTIEADQLADVAFSVMRKFDTQKKLKHVKKREEMMEVDNESYNGFFLNGHYYLYGEIYKRIK